MAKKYTIKELSEHLNVSEDEIRRFAAFDGLNFTRVAGGKIVFRQRHVDNFMPTFEKYILGSGIMNASDFEKLEAIRKITTPTAAAKKAMEEKGIPTHPGPFQRAQDKATMRAEKEKTAQPLEKTIRKGNSDHGHTVMVNIPPEMGVKMPAGFPDNKFCQGAHSPENITPATWGIGANAKWLLCDECEKLPRYKRFKKRVRIG